MLDPVDQAALKVSAAKRNMSLCWTSSHADSIGVRGCAKLCTWDTAALVSASASRWANDPVAKRQLSPVEENSDDVLLSVLAASNLKKSRVMLMAASGFSLREQSTRCPCAAPAR